MSAALAPIAVFAFKRPERTRELLESLRANPEAGDSEVHVFCDGPRDAREAPAVSATRAEVRACGLPGLVVVERERNLGLAASVIDGVTRLCAGRGAAIVLEDDLVLAPPFLAYMNEALERYRQDERVYAVSGYMYPVPPPASADAALLPLVSSWGWGTWQRAWSAFDPSAAGHQALRRSFRLRRRFDLGGSYPFWSLLEKQLHGQADSWAIRWYLSVFLRGGLSLFPGQSLVEHRGLDAEATHWSGRTAGIAATVARPYRVTRWPAPRVDGQVLRSVRRLLARDYGPVPRALNWLYRRVRPGRARPRPASHRPVR